MRSLPNRLVAVHARRTAAAAVLTVGALTAPTAMAYSVPSLNPAIPSAPTATSVTVSASLSPDRLGGRAALTITIRYSGGEFGVPSPVRRATVKFPSGLTLEIPKLESCSAVRLRARGRDGCPAASRLGAGHALAVVHAGSQRLTESVALTAFLGPLQGLQPTLLILAQGYTPLERRFVLTGKVLPASAPYGEEMVMEIPAIPSLPLEPDASLATFSLTVGAGSRHRPREQDAVHVPSRCPTGGFPFASEFIYADATNGSALATVPCPS
jgi:hypothetical protein